MATASMLEADIERLKELLAAYKELLRGYERFSSSMPFCIGEMIEGYDELVNRIADLEREA